MGNPLSRYSSFNINLDLNISLTAAEAALICFGGILSDAGKIPFVFHGNTF